jgi:hypothetical protein
MWCATLMLLILCMGKGLRVSLAVRATVQGMRDLAAMMNPVTHAGWGEWETMADNGDAHHQVDTQAYPSQAYPSSRVALPRLGTNRVRAELTAS